MEAAETMPQINRKAVDATHKLSPSELNLLKDCETKLARYQKAGLEAGEALLQLEGTGLHKRMGYRSLEAYLMERWSMTPSHKSQLIGAARTVRTLKEAGFTHLPVSEGQVRSLSNKPPELIVNAWRRITDNTPPRRRITGVMVERALAEVESEKSREYELERSDYEERREPESLEYHENNAEPRPAPAPMRDEEPAERLIELASQPVEEDDNGYNVTAVTAEVEETPELPLRPLVERLESRIDLVLDFLPKGDRVESPEPEFRESLEELDSVLHPLLNRLPNHK